MHRSHVAVLMILLLSTSALLCTKQKPGRSDIDTTKSIVDQHLNQSADSSSQPLPEADTIGSILYHFAYTVKDSAVWQEDTLSHARFKITPTESKVDSFYLSPNGKYIVCSHVIASFVSGDEDPAYGKPVYALTVIRIPDRAIIRDFDAPRDFFLYFRRWISNSRFVCFTADEFAEGSSYVFDAYRNKLQLVDIGFGN